MLAWVKMFNQSPFVYSPLDKTSDSDIGYGDNSNRNSLKLFKDWFPQEMVSLKSDAVSLKSDAIRFVDILPKGIRINSFSWEYPENVCVWITRDYNFWNLLELWSPDAVGVGGRWIVQVWVEAHGPDDLLSPGGAALGERDHRHVTLLELKHQSLGYHNLEVVLILNTCMQWLCYLTNRITRYRVRLN